MSIVSTRSAQDPPASLLGRRQRTAIENVAPNVDGARFPVKRIVGDELQVEADLFGDGHDVVSGTLLWRHEGDSRWSQTRFKPLGNDRFVASFELSKTGRYRVAIESGVDHVTSWLRDLKKRVEAKQDLEIELQIGASLLREAAAVHSDDPRLILDVADELQEGWNEGIEVKVDAIAHALPLTNPARLDPALEVIVDPVRARASAWYELFPRSTSPKAGEHGTLRTLADRLPYVRGLGFDVVYLPPIHPIGRRHRKGKNNAVTAAPDDVGSPWAIGGPEGGHKSIHPDLGTLEDFDHLLDTAKRLGLDVALDLAYQCSPDHPYVKEHPAWFKHRPDGTIQYAENPPKKYQDIYPFDFNCRDATELWQELKSVVEFWIEHGVRIFRVDNPHTKPFPFWEWLITETKRSHPDVLFLAEAFTRPKVMYRLAKLGFSHSYTYFAWRNTKQDLRGYAEELQQSPVRDFFRPHFWVNTPDILTELLQTGGRGATLSRFILAATLSPNYGVYGPVFELLETKPIEHGKEEYLDSEKYQLRHWDLERPDSLAPVITHINRIRAENPPLTSTGRTVFHPVDNDQILGFSRHTPDDTSTVLVFVNLDPHHKQSAWTDLDLKALGITENEDFQVHDLVTDARYLWRGKRNFIELRPDTIPAHIFRIHRRVRSERDFDYFV